MKKASLFATVASAALFAVGCAEKAPETTAPATPPAGTSLPSDLGPGTPEGSSSTKPEGEAAPPAGDAAPAADAN